MPPRHADRDRLGEYEKKRDFSKTAEPKGGRRKKAKAPRFVIQEHHARRLHWDLRLEHDGVAASWALPSGVPTDPGKNLKAVHTEDHPLEYLDWEGDIPEGEYGAGKMRIWDRGTYELEKWEPKKVVVVLNGERAQGRYALFQAGSPKDWMIHRMDPPADPGREPMPERLVPMLAKPGKLPPDDANWAYEIKWDGVRAIAYSEPGRLRLESRNLNDITARYPEVRPLNRELGSRTAVLDGEVVAFDENGRPDFGRLQHRMHLADASQVRRRAESMPVVYVIFDLLHLDGHSLMHLPYEERRGRLEELDLNGEAWQTPRNHVGDGKQLLAATAEQGLEGVVAKRLDSRYEPGRRSSQWLKVKNFLRQEVVIGGWLPGEGGRSGRLGALLVGVHEHGKLRFAGRVGTGFDEKELQRLGKLLKQHAREDSPFGSGKLPKGARFVEPVLIAEVDFGEWTKDGIMRHPSYKGLRDDKTPLEVVEERVEEPEIPIPAKGDAVVTIEGRELKLSNLHKPLYPDAGFEKHDVIEYYARIAPVMLPHLRGRPVTFVRFPDGVKGKSFFEKSCPRHRPDWVRTAEVASSRKGAINFCVIDDTPTLVWAANLAALELHPQLALAEAIDRPTALVFDLDPGPPADILDCCELALRIQGMLSQLGLESFAKTSGSKGLQLYVPLNTDVAYKRTKPFAKAVAETLERAYPDQVVSRMAKELRPGKVLVDWSQNDQVKTTVCAYSLRAKGERPTVSAPVSWDEVDAAHAKRDSSLLVFEAPALLERVEEKGDLFAEVVSLQQELPELSG